MKSCKNCCTRKDIVTNLLKSDMFGSTKVNVKDLKLKTCLASLAVFFMVLTALYFLFYGHAYEVDFRFPEESQLSEAPRLRSEDGRILDPVLRAVVVPFLKEQCETMEDADILFCFQLNVDARPLYSPCFMDCHSKEFYYDLNVMETDDPGSIACIETYSTLELKKMRSARIAIKGFKGMDLEEFVMVPDSILKNCLLQHADEVSRGKWLK
jgi:hypothetical protein|nr:hypothetical protein [Allomuricauda sp.]